MPIPCVGTYSYRKYRAFTPFSLPFLDMATQYTDDSDFFFFKIISRFFPGEPNDAVFVTPYRICDCYESSPYRLMIWGLFNKKGRTLYQQASCTRGIYTQTSFCSQKHIG